MFREKLSSFYLVFDDTNDLVAIEPVCMGKIGTPDCLDKKSKTICTKRQKMLCQCCVITATLCQ